MKKHVWKTYAFWILLSLAVGGLSGLLSREGMELYDRAVIQPPLSPPMWIFPVVWSILYILMGIGAARVWLAAPSDAGSRGIRLFCAQLAVNFFWSILFFNLQAYGLSFFWLLLLLGLAAAMARTFHTIDPAAGWLQLPYVLWLIFAAYLCLGVWILNR